MKKICRPLALMLALLLTACALASCAAPGGSQIDPKDDKPNAGSADIGAPLAASDAYTRVDRDGKANPAGDFLLFGSYPQTLVTDQTLASTLTDMADATLVSSNSENHAWKSYNDYGVAIADLTYDGVTYRGVHFNFFAASAEAKTTYSEANGYDGEGVYWFRYEPILWRILQEKDGGAYLLSEKILDAREFYPTESKRVIEITTPGQDADGNAIMVPKSITVYGNNYEYSALRLFLNGTFLQTAFADAERAIIKQNDVINEANTTGDEDNDYASPSTKDSVYMPSYLDMTKNGFGFSLIPTKEDAARVKPVTDYAACLGAFKNERGNGYWWLRSPSAFEGGEYIRGVGDNGKLLNLYFDYAYIGVAPAVFVSP